MCSLFAGGSIYESHSMEVLKQNIRRLRQNIVCGPLRQNIVCGPLGPNIRRLRQNIVCGALRQNIRRLRKNIVCGSLRPDNRPLWHNIARSLNLNICPLMLIFMRKVEANFLSVEETHCSHIEGKCFSSFEAKHSCVDNIFTIEAK